MFELSVQSGQLSCSLAFSALLADSPFSMLSAGAVETGRQRSDVLEEACWRW